MSKLRITFIYIITTLITLVIAIVIGTILWKLIPEYINNFKLFISDTRILVDRTMVLLCLSYTLYQNWIFMKGIYVIWRKSLQFGDFIKKAQQQKETLENLK